MTKENNRLLIFIRKYVYLGLAFAAFFLLDVGFRYAFRDFGNTDVFEKIPLFFTIAWCLIFVAIIWLLPRIAKRIFMSVIFAFFIVILLIHGALSHIFNKFFSFSSTMFAGDGAAFLDPSYISFRWGLIAVLIVCAAIMIASIILVPKEKYNKKRVIISIAAFIIGVSAIVAVPRIWLQNEIDTVGWDDYERESALYEYFTDSNNCLMLTGIYQYTYRDFYMSSGLYEMVQKFSNDDKIEALDEYYAEKDIDADNDKTGIFKDKNLIMIQLEAIDTWMLTEEFMPNLYSIQQESMDFTDHYAPMYIAAGTFNSENIANTGLVSPFTGASNNIYSRNSYPLSLPNLLKDENYNANSFHTTTGEVYSRAKIHLNWGYEKYYSSEEMKLDYPERDSDLIKAYDMMVSDDKFFSFIITYSGHGAYEGSEVSGLYYDEVAAQLPEGTDDIYIHAMAHAKETDIFIGELMDKLEADGHINDTVIVFYSDHYNYYVMDDALVMKYKDVDNRYILQQTPFFIYSADTEPEKINKVTSTIDILPTLVNLFDLDTDGRYYVGNDIFSENGGYVFFADYSWYDGNILWEVDADKKPDKYESGINKDIRTRLDMSWDTMKTDYFAHSDYYNSE